jgi:serine/threonine protein kinase
LRFERAERKDHEVYGWILKTSAREPKVNAAGTAGECGHSGGSIHVEDAATQPLAAQAQETGKHAAAGSDATPARGPVPDVELLRDNLQQGFADDAVALRDRYILDDVLAVGASYVVYKARDPRRAAEVGRNSNVAIKALRPELRSDPGAIERLGREFRVCAALEHPNVVRVFALEKASGTWFMAMELLDGKSLARLIYDSTPKRLPLARTLGILSACSAVLSLIHERRMVHHDFNPENVWITETGEVRVIGFGASGRCAPAAHGDPDNDENRCGKQAGASNSGYASPQLLAGQPPEPGDDVFSFACIAYELLGGRSPFGRWNVVEFGALHLRVVRPRGLRWPVWRALRQGMHLHCGRRTRSAADLLLCLERGLAQENAGRRGSVVEAMARYLADARRWFDRRMLERTVSVGDWFASRRAEIAKAAGTVRRAAAPLPTFANFARRPPRARPSHGEVCVAIRRPREMSHWLTAIRTSRAKLRRRGLSLPHVAFPRQGFARTGVAVERAIAQAQHLRSALVSKHVRIMRDARRVAGSWCESRWGVLKRVRYGKEWVVGARYVPAGAVALALACLTLVHGKSTFTEHPSSAVGATGTRSPWTSAAPGADDLLMGAASDWSGARPMSGHMSTLAFGLGDDCAIGSVAIATLACASASMLGTSEVHSAAAAINRPSHRSGARIALERATVVVSDRAIAAALVVTRVGSVRNPVMVRWRTIVGSAKPGEDYESVTSGTARFLDNQSVRVLYVPLKPNPNALGDRSFAVELSRPSSGAALGQIWRVVVTIEKHQ